MMTKQTKFISAIVLQSIILITIIVFKISVISSGADILLKIEPVDPRDMLRGDYVTFQYSNVSNVYSYNINNQQIRNGDTVYVVLRQRGKYWTENRIQKTKPSKGEIFIKGKIDRGGVEDLSNGSSVNSRTHIIYGIEQYFIPEGQGQDFSFRNKDASARVAVDENGNAVLKKIYIDDKPWP